MDYSHRSLGGGRHCWLVVALSALLPALCGCMSLISDSVTNMFQGQEPPLEAQTSRTPLGARLSLKRLAVVLPSESRIREHAAAFQREAFFLTSRSNAAAFARREQQLCLRALNESRLFAEVTVLGDEATPESAKQGGYDYLLQLTYAGSDDHWKLTDLSTGRSEYLPSYRLLQERYTKYATKVAFVKSLCIAVERLPREQSIVHRPSEGRVDLVAEAPKPPVAPTVAPTVTPGPAAEPLAPIAQRWAVIIGVSEYKHAGVGGLTNLRYAARDAQQLHDRLVGAAPAVWLKNNVRLLTDREATEPAVREALLSFLQKAQKDDLVLIFLSGHGTPDPARPKNNYFLCHDTAPRNLPATGFPMWEIDNALERGIIEAKRVVVLADACHSGGFTPEGMRDIRVVSRNISEGMQTLGKRATCRVVTSCEPGELSQEKADWGEGHGAFAYALIQGLAGKADAPTERNAHGNGDGKVDLDELVYYIRREVGDLTSNAQHVQDTGRLNALLTEK